MTGVDVEHTKAQLEDLRRMMATVRMHGISLGPHVAESLLAKADALVAAVERVQALHTKFNDGYGEDDYCDCCGTIWPCLTIEALGTP